jgi:hypothetical protein
MQRRQAWSVGELRSVLGIACVAASTTQFVSLELCGAYYPHAVHCSQAEHLSLSYMDHIARIGGHKDRSMFGS